jgi:signal transduction histidine kinase
MPAAVFIGNADGITRANRAGLDLLGYEEADQLTRQPVSTHIIVRDRTTAKDVIMHAVAAPIMRDGNVTGAVSVAVDAMARRRMESSRSRTRALGIADDEVPHIFEPYWSAKRHATKGTGLGLYICNAIVEGHSGEIVVESKVGRGTTFTMTFPMAKPAGHGLGDARAPMQQLLRHETRNLKTHRYSVISHGGIL